MIYDFKKLQGEEIQEFKKTLIKYKDYDKIDIIIDILLHKLGISSSEFNNRKQEVKKENKKEIVVQEISESLKYCDGDKCTINLFNKC